MVGQTAREVLREATREEHEATIDEAWSVGWRGRRQDLPRVGVPGRLAHRALRLLPLLPGLRWYAAHRAPRRLRLERIALPLSNLPAGLVGLRIGFLSDIHHDRDRPLALLARGVALLRAARPDLVLLGGDYVVGRARGFAPCARLLGELRAPLGVHGILGNHDHWGDPDALTAELTAAGVSVLRNEARRMVAPGGGPFWLVGLDTAFRGQADPVAALANVPDGAFRILLLHEPDSADNLARRGVRAELLLAGHTHGGQVALPPFGPLVLPPLARRYLRGRYATPAGPLYVSRGIGALPPFIRLNAAPEVALLTLVPAVGRGGSQPP